MLARREWWWLFNSDLVGMVIASLIAVPVAIPVVRLAKKATLRLVGILGTVTFLRRRRQEIVMSDLDPEEKKLGAQLSKLPVIVPNQPALPARPAEWGGWLETLRTRAQLQMQNKTNEVRLEHLKLVNQCYDQWLTYAQRVQDIAHLDERSKIRDLERQVEHKKLKVELKDLAYQEEELSKR